jgi:hypothetical protein
MTNPKETSWEERIRTSYKGILSDSQIEATVDYWRDFISQERKRAVEELLRKLYVDCTHDYCGDCEDTGLTSSWFGISQFQLINTAASLGIDLSQPTSD